MTKNWCVVEFTSGVQIVPNIWIEGDQSYWLTFNAGASLGGGQRWRGPGAADS